MINRKKIEYDIDYVRQVAGIIADQKKEREWGIFWFPEEQHYERCDITEKSNKTSVVRDIYRLVGFCVCNNAKRVIILHNHPIDVCWASEDDVASALLLKKRLTELNIELIDSVITTKDDMWSIAEHKWEYVEPEYWTEKYKNRRKTKPIY